MSAMDNRQIEHEFRRQVYLCSGIGLDRMMEILEDQYEQGDVANYVCFECGRKASFRTGHICKAALEAHKVKS